jgi:CheY-specific phosphatase CheX
VADVLERMFFIEVLGEATEPAVGADAATVDLSFEGDPPGRFRMCIARSAANAVAADFLGEDAESLTDRQSTEVSLELANMICGAVLSRIESSAAFRLGTPQFASGETGNAGLANETRYTVDTGSGVLTVSIQMETRTCSPAEKYAS